MSFSNGHRSRLRSARSPAGVPNDLSTTRSRPNTGMMMMMIVLDFARRILASRQPILLPLWRERVSLLPKILYFLHSSRDNTYTHATWLSCTCLCNRDYSGRLRAHGFSGSDRVDNRNRPSRITLNRSVADFFVSRLLETQQVSLWKTIREVRVAMRRLNRESIQVWVVALSEFP